jgi:hypothetical protein
MSRKWITLSALAALLLSSCAQPPSSGLEPTHAALLSYLESVEGDVMPLYMGKRKMAIGLLVDAGQFHWCTQDASGEPQKKSICSTDIVVARAVMVRTRRGEDPCVGSEATDLTDTVSAIYTCIATQSRSGSNVVGDEEIPYSISAGQAYVQLTLDEVVFFTLEPTDAISPAARSVQGASGGNKTADTAAPPSARVAADAAADAARAAAAAVEAIQAEYAAAPVAPARDAVDAAADFEDADSQRAEAQAEAERVRRQEERRIADEQRRIADEHQRLAEQRWQEEEQAERREIQKSREEADALKRLQDRNAARMEAEAAAGRY